MKLRSYLVLFSLVLVLPLLIFAAAMLLASYLEQQAKLERHVIDTARALSLAIDRETQARITVMEALAVSKELDAGNLKNFYEESRRVIDRLASQGGLLMEAVVLVDPSGQQVLNTRLPYGSPLPAASDPELVKGISAKRRPAVSNLFTARVAGKPILAVGAPVLRHGRVKYVLVGGFSPDSLTRLLLQQNLPADWLSSVIDENNIIIARTRNLDRYLGKPSTALFANMSEKGREASWKGSPPDGEPVLAGLYRSALTGWTVGVAAPVSALEAPFKRLLALTGAGALFLLVGGGFGLLFSRRLTLPINRLGEAARKVAAGELTARVGLPEGTSELRELSRSFDQMAESLQLQKNQLDVTHRISQSILAGQSLETLFQEILQALLSSLSLDFGSVRIVNADRRSLRVLAAIGYRNPELIPTRFSSNNAPEQNEAFRIIDTGRSYVVNDIPNAPGLATLKREGGQSGILVPTVDKNQNILGVLHAVARLPRQFDESEIKFVESVGIQLGIAIERGQAAERLRQSEEQLRALAARTESIREEESARISREIHDVVGQLLIAIKMNLSWIEHRVMDFPHGVGAKIDEIAKLIDEATATIRKIATDLRPSVLDHLGLLPAMESQMRDFQERSGIRCFFQTRPGELPLNPAATTALFRCCQEILSNVYRHSGATEVAIAVTTHGGVAVIEVTDNGRGITPQEISDAGSLGLLGMQERLEPLGGTLTVEGGAGKGTRVTLTAPLNRS